MISPTTAYATANAALNKKPVFRIDITDADYNVLRTYFMGQDTGFLATGVASNSWVESIDDLQLTVSDMDGGAELGDFVFTVQDRSGQITADFPGLTYEGKRVRLYSGFVGLAQEDYALMFTGKVDNIASANDNNSYIFTCPDIRKDLAVIIYGVADNGNPTDDKNPRTLNGHPLDILIAILKTEVGYGDADVDTATIESYRDGLFAGVQFKFRITSPPEAKEFIEKQIMQPLGGYIFPKASGAISVYFFYPRIAAVAGEFDTTVVVDGNTEPWRTDSGYNSGFAYRGGGGINPVILAVDEGQTVQIIYQSGTIHTFGSSPPAVDANGDPAFTGTGSVYPAHYVDNPAGAHLGGLVGCFTDDNGSIIGFPHWFGNNSTWTVPAGATKLRMGVNDDYQFVNNTGSWDIEVIATNGTIPVAPADIDDDSLIEIPLAEQAPLINQVSYRFDYSDTEDKALAESVQNDADSIDKYGLIADSAHVVEAKGMRSAFQGFFVAALISDRIFLRYGLKTLQMEDVHCFWSKAFFEPGDQPTMTQKTVPDRPAGVVGIIDMLFEVLDRTWHFSDCTVSYRILAIPRLRNFFIPPDGMADYFSASTDERARYMFMSNDDDTYSDTTTAGNTLA